MGDWSDGTRGGRTGLPSVLWVASLQAALVGAALALVIAPVFSLSASQCYDFLGVAGCDFSRPLALSGNFLPTLCFPKR